MTPPAARLHRLGGSGPDLLFVHGFGADRLSWAANAPQLTDAATVWTLDLPGHGSAPDPVGDGSAQALADAVARALPDLSGPAVIVGHSLGGTVALHLAAAVPQVVRHLVLIAPAGLGPALDHDFLTAFPVLETPDQAQALLERLVERKRLIAPAMVAHVLAGLQKPSRRAALATVAQALMTLPAPALPDLPIDLIWGAADRINPPPVALPATVLVLPDTGHMPQVEAASKVNAVIRAALVAVS